eukprot:SAG31_NODE_86_length_26973_cov_16.850897_28_plen_229_part_00
MISCYYLQNIHISSCILFPALYVFLFLRFSFCASWPIIRPISNQLLCVCFDLMLHTICALCSALRRFYSNCVQPNTTQRLTAAEALEHPWVVYRGLPTDGQAAADLATVPQTMAEYQHATRAQRAVAQLMATNLLALHAKGDPAVSAMTAAWLDHLSGIFALYDRDSDGRIRRDEIEAGLVVLRKWKSTVGIGSASVFELAPEVAAHVVRMEMSILSFFMLKFDLETR